MDNVPHSTGQAMGMKWITFFYISTIFPNYKRNMHIVEILGNAEKQNKNCSIFWHIWHISMNGLNTIFLVVVCTIVYTYFIEYPVLSVSPKFFKCFFPIAFDKFIKFCPRTSLVGQWIRICLSVQQTQVWSLVWEDPTCHGATKPMHHNYWALASRAHKPQLLKLAYSRACAPQQEELLPWEASTPQRRVAPALHN